MINLLIKKENVWKETSSVSPLIVILKRTIVGASESSINQGLQDVETECLGRWLDFLLHPNFLRTVA